MTDSSSGREMTAEERKHAAAVKKWIKQTSELEIAGKWPLIEEMISTAEQAAAARARAEEREACAIKGGLAALNISNPEGAEYVAAAIRERAAGEK